MTQSSIYVGWIGVIGVLRLQFATTSAFPIYVYVFISIYICIYTYGLYGVIYFFPCIEREISISVYDIRIYRDQRGYTGIIQRLYPKP